MKPKNDNPFPTDSLLHRILHGIAAVLVVSAVFLTWHDAKAALLVTGGFESGTIFKPDSGTVDAFSYSSLRNDCTYEGWRYSTDSPSVVITEPVLTGKYAMKLELNRNCDYRPFNDKIYQKPRTGVGRTNDAQMLPTGAEYWFGIAVYLPPDYVYDPELNPDNIYQLIKNENTGSYGKNMIDFTVVGDQFEGVVRHSKGGLDDEHKTFRWAATLGQWHLIVIHTKLCKVGQCDDGFMKIYLNSSDTPVYSATGPNAVSSKVGPAANLYKYAWFCTAWDPSYKGPEKDARADFDWCVNNWKGRNPTNDLGPRAIYIDDFNVGDQHSGFKEVSPAWNATPPPTPSKPLPATVRLSVPTLVEVNSDGNIDWGLTPEQAQRLVHWLENGATLELIIQPDTISSSTTIKAK
jgi:hypothetical protein